MPPFSLADLESSIGKRLAVPGYEVQTIAAEIYARYDPGGPVGQPWYVKRVTTGGGRSPGYDLCRGEQLGGVCLLANEAQAQALADALNDLERESGTRSDS